MFLVFGKIIFYDFIYYILNSYFLQVFFLMFQRSITIPLTDLKYVLEAALYELKMNTPVFRKTYENDMEELDGEVYFSIK